MAFFPCDASSVCLVGSEFPALSFEIGVLRHTIRWNPRIQSQFFTMFSKDDSTSSHLSEFSPIDRRGVLGALGLTGLGLLASSTSAEAFLNKGAGTPKVNVPTSTFNAQAAQAAARIDLTGLPSEWAHSQGKLLPEYTYYLTKLKLRRVSPKQVIEAHAKSKGSVWNSLPPKAWWARMGYTLRVADRIAIEMNVDDVEVISAYRAPAYNATCRGAKAGSWHQANVAVDVKFPVQASKVTATARHLRELGLFRGGVGGYWNFTHIDTRGQNINW